MARRAPQKHRVEKVSPETGHSGHSGHSLRFPAFITLAMTVTTCHRCQTVLLASVIDGVERRLDPLPLSMDGLAAAAAGGRWVAVVSPHTLLAHRAKPGHWWLTPPTGGPPTLLAEHVHGAAQLAHDPALASALLARLLPADARPADPDAPPPF
jgi:hypothetical protein